MNCVNRFTDFGLKKQIYNILMLFDYLFDFLSFVYEKSFEKSQPGQPIIV